MDSDTHPSIITQVTPDGERAKLVAELQNQAAEDVSIPDVQFNENAAAETVFSPTPKAVDSTVNDAKSGGTGDQSQAGGSDRKQPQSSGKLKSLFCCFKLCKRSGKQRGAHRYMAPNAAAKQGATVGIPQTEGAHSNGNGAQPSAATGAEAPADAARSRGSAASANGSAATGTQPVTAPHVVPAVGPSLLPPLRSDEPPRRCVVVDLDETLVHSSFKPVDNPDLTVDVEIDGQVHQVYVLKRPFVDEFLTRLGQLFECVLFTASLSKYADPVTNWLDPGEQKVFSARLFRDACVPHKGNYVKDLSRLGRPLDGVVIVDNSPVSYFFHPQNAVPVKTWFDDASDHELLELIPLFEQLATCPDIYPVIAQYQAERQAQQARELALLRSLSLPLAYASSTAHSPAAALVTAQPQPQSQSQALIAAQLPTYQYSYQYQQPSTDHSPSPPLPDYASLQSAAPPPLQLAPQDPPVPAEQPGTADPDQSQEAAVSLHGAPVIVSVPNACESPATGNGSRRQSASGAPSNSTCSTGRSTPVTGLEAPTAHTTGTGHESATENDEDRSLFSPLPVPPLFVTPPTPRPGEAGGASQSHSHSPTGSSAEAAQASSDSDAEAAPALQRRNSAGSRRSGSQDSQKQHNWRPASTQPLDSSHVASNNNGKPPVVVHAVSGDGALL